MTRFRVLKEGFVSKRPRGTPTSVAAGPRTVQARDGELICSFVLQSRLGSNDFQPVLARSRDFGATWSEPTPIWPEAIGKVSIFGSISSGPDGTLYFYGSRTPLDAAGESFWSEATQGLKQNELVWTRSRDDGVTWEPLSMIPMPIPGSAEAPGPMCVTRLGHFVACYAPYNTFDPDVVVTKSQVLSLMSADKGATWTHQPMLRFPHADSSGAESWVVELTDGRLLGTGWHIRPGAAEPNAYAISKEGGATWGPTLSTGIVGQSTGLAVLPDNRALFIYNQRTHGDLGVWLAVARPNDNSFGLEANERIWAAEIATQDKTSGEHSEWTDFAFGEPSVCVLADGTLFVALWCMQPSGYGIRYLKLGM